jgi:hypothetical protein
MGAGRGGLRPGQRWQLRVELKGALTPQKTRSFWSGLQGLLKKHKGAVTIDKLVSTRTATKPASGGARRQTRTTR